MNNTRLLFAFATAALAYMLLTQWQTEHAPPAPVVAPATITSSTAITSPAAGELPGQNSAAAVAALPTTGAQTAPALDASAPNLQDPRWRLPPFEGLASLAPALKSRRMFLS